MAGKKKAGAEREPRLNYVDFWPEMRTTAAASDDGYVTVQNNQNLKLEGSLAPFNTSDPNVLPEVKICKFLKGHNAIVAADMEGYLNFYAVVPSPCKNNFFVRKRYLNIKEQISLER